jgi:hypothetical protein
VAVVDTLQLAAILTGIAVAVIPAVMLGIDWALTRPRRNTPPPSGLPPAHPAPQTPTRRHIPLHTAPAQPPTAPDTVPLVIDPNAPGRGTLPCSPIPGVTITRTSERDTPR